MPEAVEQQFGEQEGREVVDGELDLEAIGGDLALDGSIGACTAHLSEPYLDGGTGTAYHGDEELFSKLYGDFSHANVLEFLLFNEENPNSILSCLIKARENARTIRDILSVSLWEAINRFYLRVREASRDAAKVRANPASFLERVKRGSHEVAGMAVNTPGEMPSRRRSSAGSG